MYRNLLDLAQRPKPFSQVTAKELWTPPAPGPTDAPVPPGSKQRTCIEATRGNRFDCRVA